MSNTFWKDVRSFYQLLNIARDGFLTSSELTLTFPKVLEGTLGRRNTAMSATQYQEALTAYLQRLYSAAYPSYFLSKSISKQQQQQQPQASSSTTATAAAAAAAANPNVQYSRDDLPLLLPHFEQDFIDGLTKEEEEVLHMDVQHSLKTLGVYYEKLTANVSSNVTKFSQVLIKGLQNTTYLPQDKHIIDIEFSLDPIQPKPTLVKAPIVNSALPGEETTNDYIAQISVCDIRLLFVAIAGWLYDSHKAKAVGAAIVTAIEQNTTENDYLTGIFAQIPNIVAPNITIQEESQVNTAELMFRGMLQDPSQNSALQSLLGSTSGSSQPNPNASPLEQLQQQQQAISTINAIRDTHNLGDISSNMINLIWKYCIFALSARQYIPSLIATPADSYNPFVQNTIPVTRAQVESKTGPTRAIFEKILQQQEDDMKKHEASRIMPIVMTFTLSELLNILFTTFSPELNITTTIVAINDYIGEVTYGDEDDEQDDNAFLASLGLPTKPVNKSLDAQIDDMMMILGPTDTTTAPAATSNQEQPVEAAANAPPSTTAPLNPTPQERVIQANKDETHKLLNSTWLTKVRRSFDWKKAFSATQQLTTSSSRGLVMGRMNGSNMYSQSSMRQQEDLAQQAFDNFDLAQQMRAQRHGNIGNGRW